MKNKFLTTALLLAGFTSGYALSEQTVCAGKVEQLSYHAENNFLVKLSGMNTAVMFCNQDAVWTVAGTTYKTGPESCKMLYSTFLSAQMAGATLTSVYFDGDDSKGNCQSFPSWAKVNIRYFVLSGK